MKQNFDIYLASAGTGKTSVLMDRLIAEIKSGVQPERIAFVSYTRNAAQVARERAAKLLNIPQSRLTNFRTIHSMCFHTLQASKQQMMDGPKYKDFGEQAGYSLDKVTAIGWEGLDWDEIRDRDLLSLEQLYRNNKAYFDKVSEDRIDNQRLSTFMALYSKYRKTNNYTDFTDLLEQYINEQHVEDVDVALLDEMQDSSPLQWRVVLQAFKNASRVYIAGDDKQSIYTYSGADSSILLKFRGMQHILDVSYRVPSRILAFANSIAKQIQTSYHVDCKSANAGGIVDYINGIEDMPDIQMNKSYYFLARTRSLLKPFEEWCRYLGYIYIKDGTPSVSQYDLFEYRNGMTDEWPEEKLLYIHDVVESGRDKYAPNITISTIHGVKGGEADIVVLRSDISYLVNKSMDVDEDPEHRVFYVGVTRAREELYIMNPQTHFVYPYIL